MHFRGKKQNLFKFHIDVNRELEPILVQIKIS